MILFPVGFKAVVSGGVIEKLAVVAVDGGLGVIADAFGVIDGGVAFFGIEGGDKG